jgi:uncharacterized protein
MPLRSFFAAPAALAFVLALAGPALAQAQPPPTLSANGEGFVAVIPDIAIVSIGVTTRGATARAALDENTKAMAATIATVQGEGIADRDIGTSGFSIYPLYEQRPPKPDGTIDETPARVIGYQVTNEVRVTIRDIAKSGTVLDKVVTAGANQVNGISFDVADPNTPADEALALAVKDAAKKAAIMADAAGVRLVRVLNVSGGSSPPPGPVYRSEAASFSKAVPVMPGEQRITANATVSWEIAPK